METAAPVSSTADARASAAGSQSSAFASSAVEGTSRTDSAGELERELVREDGESDGVDGYDADEEELLELERARRTCWNGARYVDCKAHDEHAVSTCALNATYVVCAGHGV